MSAVGQVDAGTTSRYENNKVNNTRADYGNTIGDVKLSDKGAKYYEELKKKYSDMDFVLVSNDEVNGAEQKARHIMLLPGLEEDTDRVMTRADFVALLHTAQGSPVVNYAMNFSDVAQDADYAEAVRWAASEGLASGYGNGCFGPDDPITREQAVVILWRQARSPMLMDYPGLTQYEDVGEISRFAQQAMAWAHQKG